MESKFCMNQDVRTISKREGQNSEKSSIFGAISKYMCGITGVVCFKSDKNLSFIDRSVDAMTHRGPDARGVWKNEKLALGHRRLSIIDTNDHANQPLVDLDQRYIIVFNGEIYNYKTLRDDLTKLGHRFITNSDTEVLLHTYMEYGVDCLQHLNGFFGFAIYDSVKQAVFIARDRLGIKPLFFLQNEDNLLFSSELRSLLQYDFPKEIDHQCLYQYLQFNYVVGTDRMIKGVKTLLPGEYIYIENDVVEFKKYYSIEYNPQNININSYEKQKTQLRDLLQDSIRKRLVADVPLGTFLSGGIDSSVITMLAAQDKSINSFSIGYQDNPFFDETHYAKLVADKAGTNHTVFSLSNEDLYSHFDDFITSIDEPFADSSALPVYILTKKVSEYIKVVLSGDGADEIFSGYNKHMAEFRIQNPTASENIVTTLHPLWNALPKSRNGKITNIFRQLHRFSSGAKLSKVDRYLLWCRLLPAEKAFELLKDKSKVYDIHTHKIVEEYSPFFSDQKDINDILLADTHLVLEGDMLRKVDMMSMSNALEVRVPFLDHRVVEFAFGLPQSSKINRTMKKKIVQDAFRDLLPADLYNRPKHGFEVPLLDYLKTHLQTPECRTLMGREFVQDQGVFEFEVIEKLIQKLHSSNPEDSHATVWAILVFQYWWKRNLG